MAFARKEGALVVSYPAGALPVQSHHAISKATKLHLGNGGIQVLKGFAEFACLETLYLNNNEISSLDGLDKNFRLKHLIASNNNIRDVNVLELTPFLEELDLSRNAIAGLDKVTDVLSGLNKLSQLKLIGNPVSQEAGYRPRIIAAVPSLTILDDVLISRPERAAAEASVATKSPLESPDAQTRAPSRARGSTARASSRSGREATTSSGAHANGQSSVLVAALEREVGEIKEKRRIRAQQELEAAFPKHVDPEWSAAATATQQLATLATMRLAASSSSSSPSKTGKLSVEEELLRQQLESFTVNSALSTVIAAGSGGDDSGLVQRGIRAALQRRGVEVKGHSTTEDGNSASVSAGDTIRSRNEASLLKTALVSSFLPPTTAGSAAVATASDAGSKLGRTFAPASTAPSSVFAPKTQFGNLPPSTSSASASSNSSSKQQPLLLTMKPGVPLSATMQSSSKLLLPPASPLRSTGATVDTITIDPALGRPVGPGLVGPGVTVDVYRPRTKPDPMHFGKSVSSKVNRLITLELSGGLSTNNNGGANSGSGSGASGGNVMAGWDKFKVFRAFVEYLQAKSNSATSTSSQPASAAASKPPSAGPNGKAAPSSLSDLHAAAASLPDSMTAEHLKGALTACKDFGLCPEPENGGASHDAAAAASAAALSIKDSERLSEYVDEVFAAMTGDSGSKAVPWQAFLAAAQNGSYTRPNTNNSTAGAASATSSSSSSAAPAGPSIIKLRKLRFRPISEAEAADRAAMHFGRASDALSALERLEVSAGKEAASADTAATIAGLRRVVAMSTERANRLSDIAAALGGRYDPPPPPPAASRPRSDHYTFKTLVPAQQADKLLQAAEIAGGALGWSHHLPLPGEEEDKDEEQAVATLLQAKRRAAGLLTTSRSTATDSKSGEPTAAALEGLERALKSPKWAEQRTKKLASEPQKIVRTSLAI